MNLINKPMVKAEPKQTIFGNRFTAQDFPRASLQGLNAIDLFYQSAKRDTIVMNDLRLLAPVSSQKTYDFLFEKAMYARRFFDRMNFPAEFTIREKAEGDKEDSFSFDYTHPVTEANFNVTIKLIQP